MGNYTIYVFISHKIMLLFVGFIITLNLFEFSIKTFIYGRNVAVIHRNSAASMLMMLISLFVGNIKTKQSSHKSTVLCDQTRTDLVKRGHLPLLLASQSSPSSSSESAAPSAQTPERSRRWTCQSHRHTLWMQSMVLHRRQFTAHYRAQTHAGCIIIFFSLSFNSIHTARSGAGADWAN